MATELKHQPLCVRVACEMLLCHGARSAARLDYLVQAYASSYGMSAEVPQLQAAARECMAKYLNDSAE